MWEILAYLVMVTFVVIINTLISLILFITASKLWRVKKQLTILADSFVAIEIRAHNLLCRAPDSIYLCRRNISNLRKEKQLLELRIRQLQQIVSLLFFGRQMWRRYVRLSGATKNIGNG